MSNNMQLPAKRVVEGEVVRNIGATRITIKLSFTPEELYEHRQSLEKAFQSIIEAQRKGVVSSVIPSEKMDDYIDGEVTKSQVN